MPSQCNRIVQFAFKPIARWKFRHVFRHSNAGLFKPKQLDMFGTLAGTKDQTDRCFLALTTLVGIKPTKIKFHLPLVGRLEPSELEVYRH